MPRGGPRPPLKAGFHDALRKLFAFCAGGHGHARRTALTCERQCTLMAHLAADSSTPCHKRRQRKVARTSRLRKNLSRFVLVLHAMLTVAAGRTPIALLRTSADGANADAAPMKATMSKQMSFIVDAGPAREAAT